MHPWLGIVEAKEFLWQCGLPWTEEAVEGGRSNWNYSFSRVLIFCLSHKSRVIKALSVRAGYTKISVSSGYLPFSPWNAAAKNSYKKSSMWDLYLVFKRAGLHGWCFLSLSCKEWLSVTCNYFVSPLRHSCKLKINFPWEMSSRAILSADSLWHCSGLFYNKSPFCCTDVLNTVTDLFCVIMRTNAVTV